MDSSRRGGEIKLANVTLFYSILKQDFAVFQGSLEFAVCTDLPQTHGNPPASSPEGRTGPVRYHLGSSLHIMNRGQMMY